MTLSFPLYASYGAGRPATSEIDAMIAAGYKGIRCAITWDQGDPTFAGTFTAPTAWNTLISYCNTKKMPDGTTGFKVSLQVGLGPTYNGQGYSHAGTNGVNVIQQLAKYMVAVGLYYGDPSKNPHIDVLELGNEPNHAKWDDNGASGETASGVTAAQKGGRYLEYLARVYKPLHALRPSLTVMTGGLGGIADTPTDRPADQFMADCYAASINVTVTVNGTNYTTNQTGPSGLFDQFNFHPYTYPELPSQDVNVNHDRGWTNMLKTRTVIVNGGDGAKPWMITEFGTPAPWAASGITLQDAADMITDACNLWGGYSWGGGGGSPLAVFTWQDKASDPGGTVREDHFGIIDFSGAPKQPYYSTIQQLSAGTTTPPPTTSSRWAICADAIDNATAQTNIANNIAGIWTAAASADTPISRADCFWSKAQDFSSTAAQGSVPGQWDTIATWSGVDHILAAYQAAGVKWQAMLAYTPNGLGGTSGNFGHIPPNRDQANGCRDYANMAWLLADHCETTAGGAYAGVLESIELGNEPLGFWPNTTNVGLYSRIFIAASQAVKSGVVAGRTTRTAYPNIKILTAGVAPATPGSSSAADAWHSGMLVNGAGPYMDEACIHLYQWECPPTNNVSWNNRLHVLPNLRTVLDNGGFPNMPIRITEDGGFNRPDSTTTNTTVNATSNPCGTFGAGPDPLNHEITESLTATRIGQIATWLTNTAVNYKVSYLNLFQLNDLNNNTAAGNWSDHAGVYNYSTSRSGSAKSAIRTALVNAIAAQGPPSRTAPTVAITGPADDPTHAVNNKGNLLFTATASDAFDPASALSVSLYRGATSATLVSAMAYDATKNRWTYTLNTTTLPDGNYKFAAKCTNSAPLTTTSAQINVTILNGTLPVETSVSPTHGPAAGSTAFTLTGTGFKPGGVNASAVKFGGTNAASFTVVSDTSITGTTPVKAAGTYPITVTTTVGTGTTTVSYTFDAATPTVTAVSPASGSTGGGTSITITGTNFLTGATVKVGGTAATGVTVVSGTSITCTTPAHTAGTVDVIVTTTGGTSVATTADHFTYTSASAGPTVTSVTPNHGVPGDVIDIVGTGFTGISGAAGVKFGAVNATSYTFLSDTELTAVVPAGSGVVDVVVTVSTNGSGTSTADVFTYDSTLVAPAVSAVVPATGPTVGNTIVAITGSGFTGATAVFFGATQATYAIVGSDTKILAVAPAASSGTVDVTVVNPVGTSPIVGADAYTYNTAPVLSNEKIIGEDNVVHSAPFVNLVITGTVTVEADCVDDLDASVQPLLTIGTTVIGRMVLKAGTVNTYTISFDTHALPNGIEPISFSATDSGGLTGQAP